MSDTIPQVLPLFSARTFAMNLRSSDNKPALESHDDPASTDDDGAWEDLVTPKAQWRSESPTAVSVRSTPRRRKSVKTVFVAAASTKRRATSRTPKKRSRSPSTTMKSQPLVPPMPQPHLKPESSAAPTPQPPPSSSPPPDPQQTLKQTSEALIPGISREEWTQAMSKGARHTIRYALDVLATSVWLLRRPLSFILFLWLLALILVRVNHTLRAAFAPLCYVPGMSRMALCAPLPSPRQGVPQWADYPGLMDVQSAAFGQLLDGSVGGSGLALEIKKAEMATADLGTLVRVSNLRSRDLIAETLSEFVGDARKTGKGLQKLSSKIAGAVDGIMAVNDYALHTIEGTISPSPSRFPLSISSLNPFARSKPSTHELVTRTFTEAMDHLAASLARLILEAHVSLANLDALETRLSTLHALVAREDAALGAAHSELLSALWTQLGGNRRELRGHNEHLRLLRSLGDYRARALVHVVTALQTLQAMSEDMEDMRERVAAPELMGSSIPVEVHMRSIRGGLERLKEGRVKAKEREEEAVRRILAIGPAE